MRILPFDATLVRADVAERVVVPVFDALSHEERHEIRAREPLSFLHAMHSPGEGAMARSREGLDRLRAAGVYPHRVDQALFAYRLTASDRTETGLLCSVPAGRFGDGGDMLSHEDTRPDLVAHLADHLREVRVSSSPVKCVFARTDEVAALLADATSGEPVLQVTGPGGLRQALWPIVSGHEVAALVDAFADIGPAYITDGHHRSAAALAVGPDTPVLVALFPDDDVAIVQFNRLVQPGADASALYDWLADAGAERHDHAPDHLVPGRVGVFVDGHWWVAPLPALHDSPPESLDPSVLQEVVLGPVLGIGDPASDPRLSFVPGEVPLDELARRARDNGVAFALAPVAMDDVRTVADRGRSMPPKSTYFRPKPQSGLVLMDWPAR